MAENENVAAIESAVAQMNAGNVDGYLELYADDLTVHGYPPGIEGKAGATEFYRAFRSAISVAGPDPIELPTTTTSAGSTPAAASQRIAAAPSR